MGWYLIVTANLSHATEEAILSGIAEELGLKFKRCDPPKLFDPTLYQNYPSEWADMKPAFLIGRAHVAISDGKFVFRDFMDEEGIELSDPNSLEELKELMCRQGPISNLVQQGR
jgi:hypothetical protein